MAEIKGTKTSGDELRRKLQTVALVLFILLALFGGLVFAKPFLAPIVIASLLTMLVLPISIWLERKGFQRGWAALICDLMLIAFAFLLGSVVFIQVKSIAREWPTVRERMRPQVEEIQLKIEQRTGITVAQQNAGTSVDEIFGIGSGGADAVAGSATAEEEIRPPAEEGENEESDDGKVVSSAGTLVMGSVKFLGTALIVFIYVFFFLLYRHKFSQTLLLLVPKGEQTNAREAMNKAGKVSQHYLLGRLLLILCLSVLYAIGFSISGLQHAILIAVIAGFLSLMPYVGNAIALLLAICMAFFSDAGIAGALGVTITYVVAQFIESYILEPYLIGSRVDLNPVMVIISVILGSAIWGVAGMAIAIPALGIVKVVCDHVPMLAPFSFLFGQETRPHQTLRDRLAKKGR